jgi:phosphopantetheine attachment domain protein
VLEILEEPISEKSINEIINCQNITDMGMTSLNMVMFIVELENKYDCKIDIM